MDEQQDTAREGGRKGGEGMDTDILPCSSPRASPAKSMEGQKEICFVYYYYLSLCCSCLFSSYAHVRVPLLAFADLLLCYTRVHPAKSMEGQNISYNKSGVAMRKDARLYKLQ